jgi:hypothetical protein
MIIIREISPALSPTELAGVEVTHPESGPKSTEPVEIAIGRMREGKTMTNPNATKLD